MKYDHDEYWRYRDGTGKPHWYGLIAILQDDGFGGLVVAPAETVQFVGKFVSEAAGEVTGHA